MQNSLFYFQSTAPDLTTAINDALRRGSQIVHLNGKYYHIHHDSLNNQVLYLSAQSDEQKDVIQYDCILDFDPINELWVARPPSVTTVTAPSAVSSEDLELLHVHSKNNELSAHKKNFLEAIQSSEEKALQQLSLFPELKNKYGKAFDVDELFDRQNTYLMYAIRLKRKEVAIRLMKIHHVNVNKREENKEAAIDYAVSTEQVDIIKELIFHGAHLNRRTSGGKTPLYRAIEKGNLEIVKLLVEHGAKINFGFKGYGQNNKKKSPVDLSLHKGLLDIHRYLSEKSKIESNADYSPAFHQHAYILLLIQSIKDRDEDLSLYYLNKINASPEWVDQFHEINENRITLVMLSAANGLFRVVKAFHGKGADLHKKDDLEQNVLHFVADKTDHADLANFLLQAGVNPHIMTKTQWLTPLHLALRKGHFCVAKALIQHNPNLLFKTDKLRNSPMEWCRSNPDMSEYLQLLPKNDKNSRIKIVASVTQYIESEFIDVIRILCGTKTPTDPLVNCVYYAVLFLKWLETRIKPTEEVPLQHISVDEYWSTRLDTVVKVEGVGQFAEPWRSTLHHTYDAFPSLMQEELLVDIDSNEMEDVVNLTHTPHFRLENSHIPCVYYKDLIPKLKDSASQNPEKVIYALLTVFNSGPISHRLAFFTDAPLTDKQVIELKSDVHQFTFRMLDHEGKEMQRTFPWSEFSEYPQSFPRTEISIIGGTSVQFLFAFYIFLYRIGLNTQHCFLYPTSHELCCFATTEDVFIIDGQGYQRLSVEGRADPRLISEYIYRNGFHKHFVFLDEVKGKLEKGEHVDLNCIYSNNIFCIERQPKYSFIPLKPDPFEVSEAPSSSATTADFIPVEPNFFGSNTSSQPTFFPSGDFSGTEDIRTGLKKGFG